MVDRKRARDATPDEIFGPTYSGHGPQQPQAAAAMRRILRKLTKMAPDFDVVLFLIEKPERAVGRLPRFNYGATVERADMVAVLDAFVAKNRAHGAVLDKIADPPPTETVQ